MAISRRKLLTSAAAIVRVGFRPRVRARDCAEQTIAYRNSGSARRHRRSAWPQRHPGHTVGGRRLQREGRHGGRKIELVIEDEFTPKDTIERFSKLVQQEKVDCVQGIISTGVGLALGPVVEEARALTIYWDGTTQDGVDEKIPNPRYLFRSTDNECEAVMSSLLAIKYWKGKFATIAVNQPRLFVRPQ